MLLRLELLSLASARMRDAEVLLARKRYDSATYLCGYAVEFALKARICKQLKWIGYPSTNSEFKGKKDLKVHDFGILLDFTGLSDKIRNNSHSEWDIMSAWKPEYRYRPIGSANQLEAEQMIIAAKTLLTKLR